ncbi:adenosine receptor A2b-like [Acipenser oxyrinchus oxyrinchus]|uniref:Adenosine receptor A2b-like n=1 Tax=Acipenser oxyrinchus oxyrinchus TaxID=40147 RepID=A0AAD8CZY7_ACIOX|nr:adenosine receptor A2b-like [Acipenser oxyrinchus oxyrinchus]
MVPLAVPFNSFENALLLLFNCALATVIVVMNVSVFISIIITKSLRTENRFIYMMSTCISDIGTGVSWYYLGIFDVDDTVSGKNTTYFISSTFLGLSYLVILAAQADRYHAVVSPFQYSRRMTPMKTVLVVCCLWVYAYANVAALNLVTSATAAKISSIGTFMCNVITLVIMLGLNIKLYLIAKYQLSREPPSAEREPRRGSLHLIIIVAGCFLLFWTPVFTYIIICNFTTTHCYAFENRATDPMRILPRVNSALTPFLYVRGCAPLKQALLGKVWKCCACSSVR